MKLPTFSKFILFLPLNLASCSSSSQSDSTTPLQQQASEEAEETESTSPVENIAMIRYSIPQPTEISAVEVASPGFNFAPPTSTYPQPEALIPFQLGASIPSTVYQSGLGQYEKTSDGKISLPVSGKYFLLQQCRYPFVAPDWEQMSDFALDGSFDEWQNKTPVVIDRAGDGADGNEGRDLRHLFLAYDDTYIYGAIKLEKPWDSGPQGTINITVENQKFFEWGVSSNPHPSVAVFFFNSDRIWHVSAGQTVQTQDDRIGRVISGDQIEFRIEKSQLVGLEELYTISVGVEQNSLVTETFSSFWVGIEKDYACAVPMPSGPHKVFVMQRHESVDPQYAELYYRALIAAAGPIEEAAAMSFSSLDVMSLTMQPSVTGGGHNGGKFGIFVRSVSDVSEYSKSLTAFQIAAHEYAHGFNDTMFGLPFGWAREGHSELMTRKATQLFYGDFDARQHLRKNYSAFKANEESESQLYNIDPTISAGVPSAVYNKSHALFETIDTAVSTSFEVFFSERRYQLTTTPLVLSAFEDLPELHSAMSGQTGGVDGTFWSGLFGGQTYDGFFQPQSTDTFLVESLGTIPPLTEATLVLDNAIDEWLASL